jgi:hypothetical protein
MMISVHGVSRASDWGFGSCYTRLSWKLFANMQGRKLTLLYFILNRLDCWSSFILVSSFLVSLIQKNRRVNHTIRKYVGTPPSVGQVIR